VPGRGDFWVGEQRSARARRARSARFVI